MLFFMWRVSSLPIFAGEEGSFMPPKPRDGPPAREYPFQIDPFQATAINCLESGHSVLVAAHTSAGKTVVAEYAFAMALRDKARVIYTSPLKALSNQKYREFQETFGDVGLMTGDVVINPSASCLVMTTEILRSMLYRGSEVVREASLIVYDEIHYIRDRERGVVWEESIILAPTSVRFAFLSATIPNAREFAEWIAVTHKSPCHVVYTDYRPTPLQHFLYPSGADGMFLVVDERGNFREDAFTKAVAALTEAEERAAARDSSSSSSVSKKKGQSDQKRDEPGDVHKIVSMIMDRNFDPVIVFSFSKLECESLADQISSLDFNSGEEKKLVDAIYASAIEVLSEPDRNLPEVTNIINRLRRGIGVHHSGMLPILKELTEILFQEGLLKVLFATETFSTGLNMPAKTVVFTNVRKFDGGAFRWISSGEYIQMSGRAGRRGLDDKGVVILILDSKLDPATAKNMLHGAPDTLYSEFHLTYSMLLNMLRVEGAEPEELMRRSYRQFQAERVLPALEARANALEQERDAVHIEDEDSVENYAGLKEQLNKLRAARRAAITTPKAALPFLQPGRLVQVLPPGAGKGDKGVWAAIVNFQFAKRKLQDVPGASSASSDVARMEDADGGGTAENGIGAKSGGTSSSNAMSQRTVVIDVVVHVVNRSFVSREDEAATRSDVGVGYSDAVPVRPGISGARPEVIAVTLEDIAALSAVRVHLPKDLRPTEARAMCMRVVHEVQRRFGDAGPPLLDPEKDMKIDDDGFKTLKKRLKNVQHMLKNHPLVDSPTLADRLKSLAKKRELAESARQVRREVRRTRGLILQEDLKARRKVLRRLGHVDTDGVVTKKGRTAAEISTGDELVLCELIYGGVFGSLSVSQIASLVSCFIWREKAEVRGRVPQDMESAYGALREAARRVARAEADADMTIDVDEYVDSFKADLMAVVQAWCNGVTFAHLMKMAGEKTFGGSLVRAIRRLEELMRQLSAALVAVGDTELAAKFDGAIEKIKRDVIFAASLFL